MNGLNKKGDQQVIPIINALQNWQHAQRYNGFVIVKSTPFYSTDGRYHEVDAGWADQTSLDKGQVTFNWKAPYLIPQFIVKFTGPYDPQFTEDNLELISLRDQGCCLSWLIEPIEEYVYVFQPGLPVQQVPTFDYYLDGREVLKGFEFSLKWLRY